MSIKYQYHVEFERCANFIENYWIVQLAIKAISDSTAIKVQLLTKLDLISKIKLLCIQ